MVFLLRLGRKIKIPHLYILLILPTILFIFGACGKAPKESYSFDLTKEERAWMEDFFTGIMIQEEAIYTLWGSKSMTIFPIDSYTDEEKEALIEQLPEEQKKSAVLFKNYDLANNWGKWERIRERFSIEGYLLFKREHPDSPKHALIYFVNTQQLALTLQMNYELFRRETGMDFDPVEVVFNMEKWPNFWEEIFDNPALDNAALIGILFGYGFENSFCFQWKWWSSPELEKFANSLHFHFSDQQQSGEATLDHLSLPVFASFSKHDKMIEKYKKEREEIKKTYVGKDFLDVTLKKLIAN